VGRVVSVNCRRAETGGVVSDSWRAVSRDGREVGITPCPDGPTLVRRADAIVEGDGTEHPVRRPVVALCTCDKSQRLPWCDSTHKALRRRGRES
jgi:CDGSH-type Zn-finger protein